MSIPSLSIPFYMSTRVTMSLCARLSYDYLTSSFLPSPSLCVFLCRFRTWWHTRIWWHTSTEPPDCPTDLKATEIESRSITISWSHPFSGNAPLTNYIIEYREQQQHMANGNRNSQHPGQSLSSSPSSEGKTFKEIVESKSSSYVIQRLHPHTSYVVRVFAQNILGISSDCSPLRVTTDREAPSSPPREVKAVAQTSTSLMVSWKPPASEHTVTGYYVGYRVHGGGGGEAYAYKTVDAAAPSVGGGSASFRGEEHCILTGLKRHTRYEIMVQAFNSKGAGPPSDHVEIQTLEFGKCVICIFPWQKHADQSFVGRKEEEFTNLTPVCSCMKRALDTHVLFCCLFFSFVMSISLSTRTDPPEAPRVQIAGSTSSSLLVSWEAKESNPILGFYLFHKSESTEWEEVSLPSKTTEYNLTALSCGRRYHLYLIAFNDAGRGPPSEVISAKTDGSCQCFTRIFLFFSSFPFCSWFLSMFFRLLFLFCRLYADFNWPFTFSLFQSMLSLFHIRLLFIFKLHVYSSNRSCITRVDSVQLNICFGKPVVLAEWWMPHPILCCPV